MRHSPDQHLFESERPTRMRSLVVLACFFMSILLYLDRFCVGLAEPYIKQDLGLNTFEVGLFFSAFFLTYALFQVPSGWLSDRYGARVMLTVYILMWSLFTAMMGLATGFGMLLLMRAAYGIGQAGAYPTSAGVISKWVPFTWRGKASSIVAFGGRLGGAIAPALTAFLIVLSVPVERSSLLTSAGILDGATVCSRLSPLPDVADSDRPAELRHIWNQLAPPLQLQITAVAEEFRPIKTQQEKLEQQAKQLQQRWNWLAARAKVEAAEALTYDFPPGLQAELAEAFNGLITSDDYYSAEVFGGLSRLDQAALEFMQRLDRGETLSPAESQRFHRLLLEATFPNELRKIYVGGWRPVMIAYGAAGLFVAAFFWIAVRDRPELHPRCNQAEVELIAANRPAGSPQPHGPAGAVPWKRLLSSRSLWLSSLSQVGTNIGWVFLVTWFPRYLLDAHHVPILERGVMASVPLFVGWAGMLGGGVLTDRLVTLVGLRWGRRLPWAVSRFVGMGAFLACPLLDSPWAVTAALAVVAFSTDLGTSSSWAFCQDVGGRYVGSVLGWGNMWGNLGAAISPVLLAWVFETHGWSQMFAVCAAAFFTSGLFSLGIDATIPVAPPDE